MKKSVCKFLLPWPLFGLCWRQVLVLLKLKVALLLSQTADFALFFKLSLVVVVVLNLKVVKSSMFILWWVVFFNFQSHVCIKAWLLRFWQVVMWKSTVKFLAKQDMYTHIHTPIHRSWVASAVHTVHTACVPKNFTIVKFQAKCLIRRFIFAQRWNARTRFFKNKFVFIIAGLYSLIFFFLSLN